MQRYILRRLAQLVPSLLLITFMVFALMHAIPGDPARMMLGAGEQLDEKQLEIVRRRVMPMAETFSTLTFKAARCLRRMG